VAAGVLAVLLVGVGAALARAIGDTAAGALIGYAALPYGFLAGLFAPSSAGGLTMLGAPNLLSAFACMALIATISGTLIGDGPPGFLGTVIASAAGALAAAGVMMFDVPAAGAMALTATILLALSPLIPALSFRAAGMPLPTLPTTADELRADNEEVDGAAILERTRKAQRHATGMIIGIALTGVAAELFLALADGWVAAVMAITLALAIVMRARVFHASGQRLWLNLTGVAGVALLALAWGAGAGMYTGMVIVVALLWSAMLLLVLGLRLPAHRPSPFWGRAADIADLLLIAALFPLALGVLDVYSVVRGLGG